ncbi:MAG: hypothetical protein M3Z37_10510 [Candidatus Eremiobacteraeota bacterium]|nr:hypothetical protein [Candidatus Eremiobacteraeota bacterium]
MKIRITMNGKAVSAQDAARDLLHPDRLAEKMLRQKIAGLSCAEHPIQCRDLELHVSHGNVQLEHLCCDAFRQQIIQTLQAKPAGKPLADQTTG